MYCNRAVILIQITIVAENVTYLIQKWCSENGNRTFENQFWQTFNGNWK